MCFLRRFSPSRTTLYCTISVVGYAQSGLDSDYGAVMVTPQFLGIGSSEISLNDIKPVNSEDPDYNIEIQVLDAGGRTQEDQDYMWIGGEWCNAITEAPVENVTFAPGQGLWVFCYTGESSVGLQNAGKVGTSDVCVTLDSDFGAVGAGNPFPVSVALADLLPEAEGEVDFDYNIEIQVLDAGGNTQEDQDYMWIGGKWCNAITEAPVDNVNFDPGQGLWIFNYTGESDVTIRFPAPEL